MRRRRNWGAAVAHAALGDLVDVLPDGLDAMVGERGTSLSGGQAPARGDRRAFLKDAPVLILDEATSHLDAVNEQLVRRALDLLQADRTTIVIAHRLSTVRDADLIVVLDGSRLIETGTPRRCWRKAGSTPAWSPPARRRRGGRGIVSFDQPRCIILIRAHCAPDSMR